MSNNTKVKIRTMNAQQYKSKKKRMNANQYKSKNHNNAYSKIQKKKPQQYIFNNTKVKSTIMNVQ